MYGWDGMGWDGRLSRLLRLLRAPNGANKVKQCMTKDLISDDAYLVSSFTDVGAPHNVFVFVLMFVFVLS